MARDLVVADPDLAADLAAVIPAQLTPSLYNNPDGLSRPALARPIVAIRGSRDPAAQLSLFEYPPQPTQRFRTIGPRRHTSRADSPDPLRRRGISG